MGEGEKTCEKQVKQVENRNERKNETRQGERVEEDNGKDVEVIKEGKKQDKSKTEETENTAREEVKKLGRNIEIIIKGIQFTKEDIKSLEEGEYFTCTGISMGISYIDRKERG